MFTVWKEQSHWQGSGVMVGCGWQVVVDGVGTGCEWVEVSTHAVIGRRFGQSRARRAEALSPQWDSAEDNAGAAVTHTHATLHPTQRLRTALATAARPSATPYAYPPLRLTGRHPTAATHANTHTYAHTHTHEYGGRLVYLWMG